MHAHFSYICIFPLFFQFVHSPPPPSQQPWDCPSHYWIEIVLDKLMMNSSDDCIHIMWFWNISLENFILQLCLPVQNPSIFQELVCRSMGQEIQMAFVWLICQAVMQRMRRVSLRKVAPSGWTVSFVMYLFPQRFWGVCLFHLVSWFNSNTVLKWIYNEAIHFVTLNQCFWCIF